jgi:hypothetical protein
MNTTSTSAPTVYLPINGPVVSFIEKNVYPEWQAAPYLLIPVVLIWVLHLFMFMEHLVHIAHTHWKMRFQALYVRLTGFFPFLALLTLLATYWPDFAEWIEFVFGCIEGYILAGFVAVLFGYAYQSIPDVPTALMASPWTRKPHRLLPEFSSGQQALRYWKYSILQFSFIKPLCTFIAAMYAEKNGTLPVQLATVLRVFQALSVFLAVLSLIRCHHGLSRAEQEPFKGHNIFAKLAVMKLLFTFIVFNNLIVRPLIDAKKFPIQQWVCTPTQLADINVEALCEYRLLFIVFLFELFMLNVPIVFLFRHHALTAEEPRSCQGSKIVRFLCRVVWIFDLHNFWRGDLVELNDGSPIKQSTATTTTTGANLGGMVAPTAYNSVV